MISKPIAMTALMSFFDKGAFQIDDLLKKSIPKITVVRSDWSRIRPTCCVYWGSGFSRNRSSVRMPKATAIGKSPTLAVEASWLPA